MQMSGQCQGCFPTWQWNDAWDSLATSHAVLLMKTITMQLLLRFTSLHQTGNDVQEDPTTRCSEPLNRVWDHWNTAEKSMPWREERHVLTTNCIIHFVVVVSGGGFQHSVCAGTRQEAHRSLSELCTQSQPCARQIRCLKPVQNRRADWSLRQLSAWQHRESLSCTFWFSYATFWYSLIGYYICSWALGYYCELQFDSLRIFVTISDGHRLIRKAIKTAEFKYL